MFIYHSDFVLFHFFFFKNDCSWDEISFFLLLLLLRLMLQPYYGYISYNFLGRSTLWLFWIPMTIWTLCKNLLMFYAALKFIGNVITCSFFKIVCFLICSLGNAGCQSVPGEAFRILMPVPPANRQMDIVKCQILHWFFHSFNSQRRTSPLSVYLVALQSGMCASMITSP